MRIGRLIIGTLTVGVLAACNAGKNQTNVELIQDMMEQPNIKSQEFDSQRGESAMRIPPENTVPRGFKPYEYKGQPMVAAERLRNPHGSDVPEHVRERGRLRYDIYCSVCHGLSGGGDGNVAQYLPVKPPSLLSDKVRAMKDGQIFHIITDGQGVMSSYVTQVRDINDRWAIVSYVRTLQKRN